MENNKSPFNPLDHADQDNDLVNFLKNFRAYWDRYGQQTLLALVVVLAVIAGYRWWNYTSTAAHEDAWSGLATATSPEAYQTLARASDHDAVRALALIRGADLLVQDAIAPTDAEADADGAAAAEDDPASVLEGPGMGGALGETSVDPQAALTSAAGMYQQVLDMPDIHRAYHLNALIGLANVAESQGEWDIARQHWQRVRDEAGEGYSMIRLTAGARLSMLDELKQPVRFGPDQPAAGTQDGSLIPGLEPDAQMDFRPQLDATDTPGAFPDAPQPDAPQPDAPQSDAPQTPSSPAIPSVPDDVQAPESPVVPTETPAIPARPDEPDAAPDEAPDAAPAQ